MKSNIKKLGKNYNGEDIEFNEDKLNEAYDEVSKILLNDIIDKNLSVWQGKELLKKIYKICSEGTLEFSKYASCKRGCSNCCYIYLDCTAVEADIIREYVVKNFTKTEIENINIKISKLKHKIPDYKEVLESGKISTYNYIKEKIPCMFLKENNSCSIYEVRPFNCRKLINFSSKNLCENGEEIVVPNISVNYITGYAINHLSMNIARYRKLKLYCEKSKEEKAVYKSLYYWFKDGVNDINREI